MKKINPSYGGYFKHEGKIYKAMEPEDWGTCKGCDFKPDGCKAPDNLCCSGRIYKDVTDTITDELVDSERKYHPIAVISVLLTGATIFGYLIFKITIKIINFLQ